MYNTTRTFLPTINKKGKSNGTPSHNSILDKRGTAESIFTSSKSKVLEKSLESQKYTPPKFLTKSRVSRLKTNEDEKTPTAISITNLKNSYTNLLEAHPPSTKKEDHYVRQSRFESMIRPLRESKDTCATEHSLSSSISPEKKVIKRPVGNHSLR